MSFDSIEQCVNFVESIKSFCYVKYAFDDCGCRLIPIDDMNKHNLSILNFVYGSLSFHVLNTDVSFWFVPNGFAKDIYFWGPKKNSEWDGRQCGFLSAEELFGLIPNEMCFILSFYLDKL